MDFWTGLSLIVLAFGFGLMVRDLADQSQAIADLRRRMKRIEDREEENSRV